MKRYTEYKEVTAIYDARKDGLSSIQAIKNNNQ
jgi:hypothetical protein